MATTTYTFARIEKKDLLSASQYETLRMQLEPYFQIDAYGKHTICNIYFDTDDDLLIRRSIEKPVYKEKLRLRSYGIPNQDSTLFLEIKKKYKKVVYKRRISLSLPQAQGYLQSGQLPQGDGQILKELRYFTDFYHPKPRVFLAYDRIAMAGRENQELRVTFDQNIRCREDRLDLSLGDDGALILPQGQYLMELKVPGAFPLWLTRILSSQKLYPTSYSKYGSFYTQKLSQHLHPEPLSDNDLSNVIYLGHPSSLSARVR